MSKFFHNLSNNSGEFVTNSGYIKINSEIIWFETHTIVTINGTDDIIKLETIKRGQFGTIPSPHTKNSLVYLFNYSNNPALDKCLDTKLNILNDHNNTDNPNISHEVFSTKTSDLKEVVLNLFSVNGVTDVTATTTFISLHGSIDDLSNFFHNLPRNNFTNEIDVTTGQNTIRNYNESGYVKINSEIIYFKSYRVNTNSKSIMLKELKRGQFGTVPSSHTENSLVYLFNYSNNPALDKCLDTKSNFEIDYNNNGNPNISHEVISTKTSDLKEVVLNLFDTDLNNTKINEIRLYGNIDAMSSFFHNLSNDTTNNSGYIKINSEIIWFREFSIATINTVDIIKLTYIKRGQFGTKASNHIENSLVYLFNYSNNPALDKCLDTKLNILNDHNNTENRNISHEVISTKTSDLKEVVLNLLENNVTASTNNITLHGSIENVSKFFHNLPRNNSVDEGGDIKSNNESGYVKINSEIIWFESYEVDSNNVEIILRRIKRGQFGTKASKHTKNSLVYLFNYSSNPVLDKCLAFEEINDENNNDVNSFFTKVGGVEKQNPTYEGEAGPLSSLPSIEFNYPEENRPINLDSDGSVRVVTANDKLIVLNYWSEITEEAGEPTGSPHGLHEDPNNQGKWGYFNKDFQHPDDDGEDACFKLLTDETFYNNWIPLKNKESDHTKKEYLKDSHVYFEITNRFLHHGGEFTDFKDLSKNIGFFKQTSTETFQEKSHQKTMSINTSNYRYMTIYAICNRVFNDSNIHVNSEVFLEYSHNNNNFQPFDNIDNLLLKNNPQTDVPTNEKLYRLPMTNTSITNDIDCYRQLDFRFSNPDSFEYSESTPITIGPGLPKFIRFKHQRNNVISDPVVDPGGSAPFDDEDRIHKNIDKYVFFCQLFN